MRPRLQHKGFSVWTQWTLTASRNGIAVKLKTKSVIEILVLGLKSGLSFFFHLFKFPCIVRALFMPGIRWNPWEKIKKQYEYSNFKFGHSIYFDPQALITQEKSTNARKRFQENLENSGNVYAQSNR